MNHIWEVLNIRSSVFAVLIVFVLSVHGSGYLSTSIVDPDNPPSLLGNAYQLDIRDEANPKEPPLHVPQFAEGTTKRPRLKIRRTKPRTTTTPRPAIEAPTFIEQIETSQERPAGAISNPAYLTYLSNQILYRSRNRTNLNKGQFNVVTVKKPTRLHTNAEYLNYMLGRNPMAQLVNFNVPFKSNKSKENAVMVRPTMMKGLVATVRRTMMGMVTKIQSMWDNMLSFVNSKCM